jgi:GH3 auxin-responsive promoter
LRLISVWHPSFLTLLLDALPRLWERLLNVIGQEPANELRHADTRKPQTIWPRLRVISCWGGGAAALPLEDLRTRFPGVCIQPKGLLATEALVTLPFGEHYPLAVQTHFFEFINSRGDAIPVEKVREGEEYEIVVTTSGGLWRYRLGDRVRVTGWLERTPSLTFIGRTGNVSDLFGEKLSEPFVAQALAEVFGDKRPCFALLAPDEDEEGQRYTLYMQGKPEMHWTDALDRALRQNPHYAYCRDLGQLVRPRIFLISERGFESFAARQAADGIRLGDIKPTMLSRTAGWSNEFSGSYLNCEDPLPALAL